ncbi:hypothetical protein C8T65DRAFT_712959 [Cerioporus squamosus]|nr:hypothetical protein C8T65DRAFT_712959 [Cerioporus squamosus]
MRKLQRLHRWFARIPSMVKRCKDGQHGTRYTFEDEDDNLRGAAAASETSSTMAVPNERHRHVDYCYAGHRPSTQTSYVELPQDTPKRPRSNSAPPPAPPPSFLSQDDLGDYRDGVDHSYTQEHHFGPEDESVPRARTASDRPLLLWSHHVDEYLAELLRLEGRGEHTGGCCTRCGQAGAGIYRCDDCANTSMFCAGCIVADHVSNPLHRIKPSGWFQRSSLKSLGLRVQLGHEPGNKCWNPKRAFGDDFVVLDVSGIHEVGVDFCGCQRALPHFMQLLRARWYPATYTDPRTASTFRLLEDFHLMSTQSKVSGWEYYTTLSRRTDNTGVQPSKDRYPSFMLMARQWRHLKMMKRGGRGHDPAGVKATARGECAVECPACPQDGKNLPNGWENAPAWLKWIYQIFVSLDANFRMKRKKISSEANDPDLNRGCAYVVEDRAYKAFLEATGNMPTEKHAHCNNHNAVKLANLKNHATLAATGIGAVDCARHGLRRPCSVGDLQKGERYANMDYLLNSTLRQMSSPTQPLTHREVMAIYDIACQFGINLNTRFVTYGFTTLGIRSLRWAVPKFHIAAHREWCRSSYSLHYLPRCGRIDGEFIERNWSLLNPIASSTKEMGPGSRRDVIDDAIADQNWQKVVKMPWTLLEKIKTAVPECSKHAIAFEEYSTAFSTETIAEWTRMVEAWEADRSAPNPFIVERATIRHKLLEDDAEALRLGSAVILHEDFSSSTMLSAGIDLEEQQREHIAELAGMHEHATNLARAKALDRQNSLHRKLAAWFKVQQLFMPGVTARRAQLTTTPTSQLPHKMPILLPSTALMYMEVDAKLVQQEWLLREAQAHDALAQIRGLLELRFHLYKVKDRFARGQGMNTRSMNSIATVQYKIDMTAVRYRAARTALTALSGPLHKDQENWRVVLKELNDGDLRHVSEDDEATEGTRAISWIWRQTDSSTTDTAGIPNAQESVQESLRVEWCKARARAHRWKEECVLVEEEMRRVVAYHKWAAKNWESRIGLNFQDRPDYYEGARAYALRQSSIRTRMHQLCSRSWTYASENNDSMSLSDTSDTLPHLATMTNPSTASIQTGTDGLPELETMGGEPGSTLDMVSVD